MSLPEREPRAALTRDGARGVAAAAVILAVTGIFSVALAAWQPIAVGALLALAILAVASLWDRMELWL